MLYKKFIRVRLTPTKIPGLVEAFSDIECDIEEDEPYSDFNSDNADSETGAYGVSTNEESEDSEEENESRALPPPTRKRTRPGRIPQPDPGNTWFSDNTPPLGC